MMGKTPPKTASSQPLTMNPLHLIQSNHSTLKIRPTYWLWFLLSLIVSPMATANNGTDTTNQSTGFKQTNAAQQTQIQQTQKQQPTHQTTVTPNSLPSKNQKILKPLSGRRVYKRVCMACHTLDVWGAPKLGDRDAWAGRIAKGKEALYYSALNGLNNMPPRGYCQFCTDNELKSAVDYMVEKTQPRKK